MPELPEVETVVRDLRRLLPGATIVSAEILHPNVLGGVAPSEFAAGVAGRRVLGVERRAKNILIGLDAGRLVVNLGMTGRLLVEVDRGAELRHVAVRFPLDDGRELRYHDVRRFGRLHLAGDLDHATWEARFGPEPLGGDWSADALHAALARSRTPVKTWLMDQRRVAGVGNIYASEALFRAGIDPQRRAESLSRAEAARLHEAVRMVLADSIEHRGTTLSDYRDAANEPGGFAGRLRVYDRAGERCGRCGGEIQRLVQAGRSTFFCPDCQA